MTTPLERDLPGCLYVLTASPPAATPPLHAPARAEIAVIGAGYTGLSTALHLAEQGHAVVVLEAREPGWGAAGRNGGQLNAGLKHEPDQVERDLGGVFGPRLVQLAGGAPEYAFGLIERLGIDCDARREGTLRVAVRPRHVAALQASAEQWRRRGVELDVWQPAQIAAATGTRRYAAATFDRRGGSVNPLSLARGLAAAAIAAGATIHSETPALGLERRGRQWSIATPKAAVLADRVVLATDGYSDQLWPGLRTSIVPIYSSIIATDPLPHSVAATVLPDGGVVYESGDITVYYRRDGDNRLLMGGRGRQAPATNRADYIHLIRYAEGLWPGLAAARWSRWWNGQFALTPDFYPRFHAPAPGLFIALGYSGRGVALGIAVGGQLAAAASGADLGALALPVSPIAPIALHRYWKLGVAARVAYGRLRDRFGR